MSEALQFDQNKFRDLVHFVISRCQPEELGRVKLHKILYFSDMLGFLASGRPITGEDYIKQKFGPTARHLQSALRDLANAGRVEVSERAYFGYPKQDFVSRTDPDLSRFSEAEIAIVEDMVDFVCARTAREISEFSHNDAWKQAEMGETIPYFMAYSFVPCEITDDDREWARDEARRVVSEVG